MTSSRCLMRRFINAFNKQSPPGLALTSPRGFHGQRQNSDPLFLRNQMTIGIWPLLDKIQGLHRARKENEIWPLLDRVNVRKFRLPDKEKILQLLESLSLDSHAKNLILKFQPTEDGNGRSNLIRIYAASVSQNPHIVMRKLKEMHCELKVATTQATYDNLLRMVIIRHKQVPLALEVVNYILEEGLHVDLYLLNRILVTIHYTYEFHMVPDVYTMICDGRIKPDEVLIETMISLLMKMNYTEEAKHLLHQSSIFKIAPNTKMYNIMLHRYFVEKEFQKGWELLHEMDSCNVKRNVETYNCLLKGCETEDNIIQVNLEMKQDGVVPKLAYFEEQIKAYANCGLIEKAKQCSAAMLEKCGNHEVSIERRAQLMQEGESFGTFHDVALDAVECMAATQQREQGMLVVLRGVLEVAREGRIEWQHHVGLLDLKG